MNQLEQMEMYAQAFQEAQRIKLEDDIRALEHYKAYGYFSHRATIARVTSLIEALKGELKTL